MSGLEVLNLVRQALASQTWTGSWTGLADNPSAASVIHAMTGVIGAGSGFAAYSRASRNALVIGSIPIGGSVYLQVIGFVSRVTMIANRGPWTE